MEVKLFEGVEAEPSVETVMRGAKMMQEDGYKRQALLTVSVLHPYILP